MIVAKMIGGFWFGSVALKSGSRAARKLSENESVALSRSLPLHILKGNHALSDEIAGCALGVY
jgi:hypothetical protein